MPAEPIQEKDHSPRQPSVSVLRNAAFAYTLLDSERLRSSLRNLRVSMPAMHTPAATTEEIKLAIQKWREADLSAAKAEKAVTEASFLESRLGPPVLDDLVGDAKLLRSLANDRLAMALRMICT